MIHNDVCMSTHTYTCMYIFVSILYENVFIFISIIRKKDNIYVYIKSKSTNTYTHILTHIHDITFENQYIEYTQTHIHIMYMNLNNILMYRQPHQTHVNVLADGQQHSSTRLSTVEACEGFDRPPY